MTARSLVWLVTLTMACLDDADFQEDAPCPCVAGYVCCPSTNVCEPEGSCPLGDFTKVRSFSPVEGSVEGGTVLTFEGSGLDVIEKIEVGDRPCHDLQVNESAALCVAGPNAPGSVRVAVHLTDGSVLRLPTRFRFVEPPLTWVPNSGLPQTFGRGITVYDATGNGWLDVLVTEVEPPRTPTLYENLGGLRFAPAQQQPQAPTFPVNGATAADFDNNHANQLLYWPQAGSGADALLVGRSALTVAVDTGIAAAHAVDVDGDGFLDVVGCRDLAPGTLDRPLFFARGDGMGRLQEVAVAEPRSVGDCNASALGDVDRDGRQDVLVCGDHVALLMNVGGEWVDRTLEVELPLTTIEGARQQCVSAGLEDFDMDGDLDVWIATHASFQRPDYSEGLLLFANQLAEKGVMRYSPVTLIDDIEEDIVCLDRRSVLPLDAALLGGARSAAWLDYDLDGDLDVFLPLPSMRCADEPWLYESRFAQGESTFVAHVLESVGVLGGVTAAVAADFDRDGDVDVVTHQENGSGGRSVYRNEAVENGHAGQYLAIGAPPGSTVEIDLDGPAVEPDFALGRGRLQVRTITGDGFGAQRPHVAHFGLGDRTEAVFVRLRRSDGTSRVEHVEGFNRTLSLE